MDFSPAPENRIENNHTHRSSIHSPDSPHCPGIPRRDSLVSIGFLYRDQFAETSFLQHLRTQYIRVIVHTQAHFVKLYLLYRLEVGI